MNRLGFVLLGAGFVGAVFSGCGACAAPAVLPRIAVRSGELTLADLLSPEACPQWLALAREVSLGAVPRLGSERVFEGTQIQHLLESLGDRVSHSPDDQMKLVLKDDKNKTEHNLKKVDNEIDEKYKDNDRRIPERIVVRNRDAIKSCAEIAGFVGSGSIASGVASETQASETLDCAAARGVPEDSSLELLKAGWNPRLARREYQLRCSKPEDCVPFLVWSIADKASAGAAWLGASGDSARLRLRNASLRIPGAVAAPLIKRGQTAMLIWDRAGIRVVAPVTCLEGGALGQLVRVRFQNVGHILRAEVIGAGRLRATL